MHIYRATIVCFVLICAAPVAALVFGPVAPYGSPHPAFPELGDVLSAKVGTLDELGEAVLHRSSLSELAVEAKNWTAYHVFHHVDTPKVVSGRGDWLFYKPEFWGGACQSETNIARAARQIDVLTDVAAAAGISLTVSISPDKSTLFPERMKRRLAHYAHCKVESGALLREILSVHAPAVVDHAVALRAEKAAHPERKLYFHTDTHWTPYGQTLALRQLVAAVVPGSERALSHTPRLARVPQTTPTDLRSGMLRLPEQEGFYSVDEAEEARFYEAIPQQTGTTLLLHDSFYERITPALRQIFPGLTTMHLDAADEHAAALATPDRVIINVVERAFLRRVIHDTMAAGSPLTQALVQRNVAAAQACEELSVDADARAPISFSDVVEGPTGYVPEGQDPLVILRVPDVGEDAAACIRLQLSSAKGGTVEMFFPRKQGGRLRFEAARSIRVPFAAGDHTLALVLPAYVNGRGVRVDLGDSASESFALRSVSYGRLPHAARTP